MAGPLLKKVSVLAAKIETTIGTAISLDATNATFNVYNAQITPNVQMTDREGQGAFSKLTSVLGQQTGTCTFSTDLIMGTSESAWSSTFLPACGLGKTSTTYACKSEAPGSTVKTLTMALYVNGVIRRLRGAVGNFVINCLAGQKISVDFTFQGVYDAFEAGAILAPTYATNSPLRWAASTTTIGGTGVAASSLTFDLGNVINQLESQAVDEGVKNFIISDRRPTLTIDPEADTSNSITRYTNWIEMSPVAVAWNSGLSADGGKWDFSIPAAQTINQQPGERSGIETEQLQFLATKSAALNDEFTMTYTLET
jgi:hypothetical protein